MHNLKIESQITDSWDSFVYTVPEFKDFHTLLLNWSVIMFTKIHKKVTLFSFLLHITLNTL